MLDAGILQFPPVQRHPFEVRALALDDAVQGLAIAERHRPLRYQWDVQQIVTLSRIGIEPQLVEGEPRRHRPAVIVARQAVGLIAVVLGNNLAHAI